MTAATTGPARGTRGRRAEGHRLSVLADNQLARWFAAAVLGLNAIDQMFSVPAYPFWSLTVMAVDVVALHGLCALGSRANLTAAPPAREPAAPGHGGCLA